MLACTAIAAREPMLSQIRDEDVPLRRGFELLGVDVFIDRHFKPWLLECNLLPSLSVEAAPATEPAREEHAIKRGVVRDTLSLLGITLPPLDAELPANCTFGYDQLVPDPALLPAFPLPRRADLVASGPTVELEPDGVRSHPLGDHLLLADDTSGRLILLDRRGAEIWRSMAAPSEDTLDTLAAWMYAGLIRRRDSHRFDAAPPRPSAEASLPNAKISSDGTKLLLTGKETATLPGADIVEVCFPRVANRPGRRALTAREGISRLLDRGLRAVPGSDTAQLLEWLATRRYYEVAVRATRPPTKQDWIAECLTYVATAFERHGIWYSLAYGTLLGALRDGDVIAWDYDFDLLVKPEEVPRILALAGEIAKDGFVFEPTRKPPNFLAVNPAGVTSFSTAAIGVWHRGRKVGDLYSFSLFSDGIMRRWDFDADIYWCPHSSFPAFFVEEMCEVKLRGRPFRAVRCPEQWIAGVYGADWRTPYKAVAQGGNSRSGVTVHGDRYEPKLREEIAWCVERGWDPTRYAHAHAWPRPIGGAGPKGPTARTRDNSRALWWRDLDELRQYF
jgi:hypothetical protein